MAREEISNGDLGPELRAKWNGMTAELFRDHHNIVGQQWGAKQTTGTAASAFTYHQTFTVEAEATRFRFKMLNTNTSAMTISAGAVAVSNQLGTGAQRYTPSTGVWRPITWDGGSLTVTVAAGSADRPTIKWTDWIYISTIAPIDGTSLPVVMTRFYLPTGAFSVGNYSFAPWSATSGFNNGRFLYGFRDAGDYTSGSHSSFPGTAYANPFLMGFEYQVKKRSFTFAFQGDSITEGAVNGSSGNFGNGWAWQTISALRLANPNVVIGYVNNGSSGAITTTSLQRTQDFVSSGCAFDAMIYSPFSPNDATPNSGSTASQVARTNTALAAMGTLGKPAIIWTPCVNTVLAWDATADGFRTALRTTLLTYSPGVKVIDIEAAISDGAVPARFPALLTTDGTHPNEAGYAAISAVAQPILQTILDNP